MDTRLVPRPGLRGGLHTHGSWLQCQSTGSEDVVSSGAVPDKQRPENQKWLPDEQGKARPVHRCPFQGPREVCPRLISVGSLGAPPCQGATCPDLSDQFTVPHGTRRVMCFLVFSRTNSTSLAWLQGCLFRCLMPWTVRVKGKPTFPKIQEPQDVRGELAVEQIAQLPEAQRCASRCFPSLLVECASVPMLLFRGFPSVFVKIP